MRWRKSAAGSSAVPNTVKVFGFDAAADAAADGDDDYDERDEFDPRHEYQYAYDCE